MLEVSFEYTGLYFNDEEGIPVVHFRSFNMWDLDVMDIGDEAFRIGQGFEAVDRIEEWLEKGSLYQSQEYDTLDVLVFKREIAFGPMYVLCVKGNDRGTEIAKVIARIVEYQQPDYAVGTYSISTFDGDEEKEDIVEVRKLVETDNCYTGMPPH